MLLLTLELVFKSNIFEKVEQERQRRLRNTVIKIKVNENNINTIWVYIIKTRR